MIFSQYLSPLLLEQIIIFLIKGEFLLDDLTDVDVGASKSLNDDHIMRIHRVPCQTSFQMPLLKVRWSVGVLSNLEERLTLVCVILQDQLSFILRGD